MSTQELVSIRDPDVRPLATLDWRARLDALRAWFTGRPRVIVAYSGGVDSSVLLRVAHEQLGERALGVIGRSDSYARREFDLATAQASGFGAALRVVTTGELADSHFASNPANRCYHCKSELYRQLSRVAGELGEVTIVDGTIADDLTDWRPGRAAAAEHGVHSPLAELGFSKRDVRAVADFYGLASSEKPASPCLASRIPYGTPITRAALVQIERAEEGLRSLGFPELRVRHHGEVARLELPLALLSRMLEPALRERVVETLRAEGFRYVALDLEGFRSGGLNRSIESDSDGPKRL